MNKVIYTILFLLVFSSFVEANAQNKLQNFLSEMVKGETANHSKGLKLFAEADYQKAYKHLQKADAKNTPYLKDFLQNALLYQRDNKLIKKAMQDGSLKIPEPYEFYLKYPQMKVTMAQNSTSVDLSKNLFKATLGDGEAITIMLDTGGSGVGISKELVDKYRMEKDNSIKTRGSLPAFNVTFFKHPVIIPKITIGQMELTGIYAQHSVADPASKGKYTGPKFDVIMGLDTFIGFLDEVTFDWENKRLIFTKLSKKKGGKPFLFHSSKPFTSYQIKGQNLTTIIDTGSAVDLLPKEIYLKNYTKKERKKYEEYVYNEYTVKLETDEHNETLVVKSADYLNDLNFVIGGEKIDFLIGNGHKKATFNLKTNRFQLR